MATKKIKKKILFLTFIILIFILFKNIPIAQAEDNPGNDPNFILKKVQDVAENSGYSKQTTEETLETTVAKIVQVVLGFLGILFLILIIIGGYQWMSAGGNEEIITKARKRIINATIGLAIIILSYMVTMFIMHTIYKSGGVV